MALTHFLGQTFAHTQDVASSVWTINHQLGGYPVVDVYLTIDGVQQKIIPMNVQYTNASTCVVSFSSDQVGVAIVS